MRRVCSIVPVLVLVLAACGGGPRAAPAAPMGPAADDGPSCDAVSTHLVELAVKDNGTAAPVDVAAGMRAEFSQQCVNAPWSAERRGCLLASSTQDATLDCPAD